MLRKIVALIYVVSFISACSTIDKNDELYLSKRAYEEISEKYSESNNSSSSKRWLAFPFHALGGIMIGVGGLAVAAAGSDKAENSQTESMSDGENLLLGLGLIGGGTLVWGIGNAISD